VTTGFCAIAGGQQVGDQQGRGRQAHAFGRGPASLMNSREATPCDWYSGRVRPTWR
jgi:hypothetical protein